MSERLFTRARRSAERAKTLFETLNDPLGLTDAVHLIGLIELQQGRLDKARELFDRSLVISRDAPERLIFLSDYHRHVAIIYLKSDSFSTALEELEKSLAFRDAACSRDYGLFARTFLGSVLIENSRPEEAQPYLEEALRFALALPSPVGELRATFDLGQMYEARGLTSRAIEKYRRAVEIAAGLGSDNYQSAAREALERLHKDTCY